jgi:hypothetical protein
MDDQKVVITLKRFLLIEQCPAEWKRLDLYLFRDENVVFYVGQSYLAFTRVWEHLLGGFKGHSRVGRFLWVNWPTSMNFTIELLGSHFAQFEAVEHELNIAERQLIQQWAPCFNVSLNNQPTPLPKIYLPPNAKPPVMRSLNKMRHESERAVQVEEKKLWLKEIENE